MEDSSPRWCPLHGHTLVGTVALKFLKHVNQDELVTLPPKNVILKISDNFYLSLGDKISKVTYRGLPILPFSS